jgi:hypothetical protein
LWSHRVTTWRRPCRIPRALTRRPWHSRSPSPEP